MMEFMNHPDLVGFYALGAVAIFASLRVVTHANPVHAILAMIVTLLALSGIFFVLGAPFAGALEIVVYAGAIMVLFVFVIMMLNLGMADEAREERWLDAKTWAIPTGLTLIIAVVLYGMIGLNHNETAVIGGVNVPAKAVGTVLFTKYIMLVKVAAFLLLAALVAAYHLGKESNDDEIVDNDSLAYRPSVGSIKEYDEDKLESNTDATEMAKPYVYDTVDPNDYVAAPRSKRKELD